MARKNRGHPCPSEPSKSNLEIHKLYINDIRSTSVSNFPELGQHMQDEFIAE